ncbi:hypothetical protein [Pedobacter mendelii]|uniref:Transposase IS200-like domain-containing protein n=1 Tax=Pedobacter mendelii TaxID=1908240 RepID=A0ABQ2BLF6_9SPHI|nr:hypothetical protein [Pedobacter mendelii]GGI27083.1 hypothetical protein GCM10008119_25880 [Pedobacter mendelii]
MKYVDKFHPDNFYHIFNHAVGNENLFNSHENYIFFLSRFEHYIYPIAKTFSYCLMRNHFHFLIQVRDENIIRELANNNDEDFDFHKFIMQRLSNFLNSYAKAFNKQNNRKSALFLDFTKRAQIQDETYFLRLINYIHQNPVHHQFCKTAAEWYYSSYNSIISLNKFSKLERDAVFDWFGGIEEFVNFHQKEKFSNFDFLDL